MKKYNVHIISLLALLIVCCSPTVQADQSTTAVTQEATTAVLKDAPLTMEKGTTFDVVTLTPLSTSVNRVGDPVKVKTITSVDIDDHTFIPAGSVIDGQIVFLRYSDITGTKGQMKIIFTKIETTDGQTIPVEAQVVTEDGSGLLMPKTEKPEEKTSTARKVIETGLGLAFGLTSTGKDLEIPSGSRLNLVLNKKLVIPEKTSETVATSEKSENTTQNKPAAPVPEIKTLATSPQIYSGVEKDINDLLISLMESKEQKLKVGQYLSNLDANSVQNNKKNFNALEYSSLKVVKDIPMNSIYKLHTLYDLFSTTKRFSPGGDLQLDYDQRAKDVRKYFDNSDYYPLFVVLENPAGTNKNSRVVTLNEDQLLAVVILEKAGTSAIKWSYLKEFPGFEGKGLTDKLLYLLMDKYIFDANVLKTINQFVIGKDVVSNPYVKPSIDKAKLFTPFQDSVYVNLKPDSESLKQIQAKIKTLIYEDVTKQKLQQPQQTYSY